jgi:predicted NBD/HSP70 family sugar kinase
MHGSPGGAGEIGHIVVAEDGDQCACGHHGCLETVASSRWVVRRVREHLKKYHKTSYVNRDDLLFEDVVQAFNEGNEFVRQVVLDAGHSLGIAASNLVGILGGCQILIGGNMGEFGQFLIDAMREEMNLRTLPSLARNTELGIADVGSDIVILGATALILDHELGVL